MKYHEKTARYKHSTEDQNFHWRPAEIVTLTVIMSWFTLVVTDDDRLKCVTLTVIISWFTPVVADDDGVFTSATNHTSVKHCSAATLHQQYNMLVNKHQH